MIYHLGTARLVEHLAVRPRRSIAGDCEGCLAETVSGGGGRAVRSVYLIALSAFCLVPLSAVAQERCAGSPGGDYSMEVRLEVPPAQVDRTRSRAELTKLASKGRGAQHLGLMTAELEIQTTAEYASRRVGERRCFWVDKMDVVLSYTSLDIYVAKEYRKTSCAYRAILAHEREHVAIAQSYLKRYAPRIRTALTSLLIPDPGSPLLVDSAEAAEREIEALFAELLQPIYQEMHASIDKAQAKLDTPQAYRRVHRRCRDW